MNIENVTLRMSTEEDADRIKQLTDVHAAIMDNRVKAVGGKYLLALVDDKVIGMSGVKPYSDKFEGWEINTTIVHPEYRNHGIATMLLKELTQYIPDKISCDLSNDWISDSSYQAMLHVITKLGLTHVRPGYKGVFESTPSSNLKYSHNNDGFVYRYSRESDRRELSVMFLENLGQTGEPLINLRGRYLLVIQNGWISGVSGVFYEREHKRFALDWTMVDEGYRNKGLATELIGRLKKHIHSPIVCTAWRTEEVGKAHLDKALTRNGFHLLKENVFSPERATFCSHCPYRKENGEECMCWADGYMCVD